MAKQRKTIQDDKIANIIINNQIGNERDSLFDRIKNNPVIIYAGIAIMAFGLGFGTKTGIETASNQELITKNSYILLKDLEQEYISIDAYNELKTQNKEYGLSLLEKDSKITELESSLNNQKEWQKRYDLLVSERKGLENELANYNNFSTGIAGYSAESHKIKKEELLRKIAVRDEQIKILLEKMMQQ